MKRLAYLGTFFFAWLILAGCSGAAEVAPTATPEPTETPIPEPTPIPPTPTPEWVREGWELVWQDEFEGEEVDRDNWAFELGMGEGGWGNGELQWYTDRPENVRTEDGFLVIEAREEEFLRGDYTSARMKTEGLHTWTYGRFEARIQITEGKGIWPAFWLLGDVPGQWPFIGEIDIMESIGSQPNVVHTTVHGPGYFGGGGPTRSHRIDEGIYADDFYIFAVEWEKERIDWYIDDELVFTLTPDDVPGEWVYDHAFFIILNVAVGGEWPGAPNESTSFPQQMRVDYVRVYQRAAQ